MCSDKRLLGPFETDWAGHRIQLRHQPNVFGTPRSGTEMVICLGKTATCASISTVIVEGWRGDLLRLYEKTPKS